MRLMTRPLPTLGVLALFATLASPAAFAADPPPVDPIVALKAKIDAARTAKNDGDLASAMKEIPPLYKGTQDAASRDTLRKELGTSMKNAKMPGAREAARAALVETEDGAKAWGVLQPVFPAADLDDTDGWGVKVLEAVGALHPEAAVPSLIDLVKKGKKPELCAKAVEAFGKYHTSKARVAHLEDLVKAAKLLVPAKSATKSPSPETQAKWAAVAPALGKALDELTGTPIGDATQWIKKIDETKDLHTLFKD